MRSAQRRTTQSRPSNFQDANSYSAIRFQVNYGTIDSSLPSEVQTWLKDTLLPATTTYLSQLLRVVPVSGKLSVARRCSSAWSNGNCAATPTTETCGSTTIADADLGALTLHEGSGATTANFTAGSGGYSSTDYLIYVTATEGSSCSGGTGTLAYAGSCRYDQYDRPVVGYLNLCPGHLSSKPTGSDYTDVLSTAIHEVTHALGFAASRYAYFWDHATGKPRTARDNLHTALRPT